MKSTNKNTHTNGFCEILVFLFSVIGLLLSGTITSCKKFIQIDPPEHQIVSDVVFATDQSALSAISGMYSKMMQSNYILTNGGVTIVAGLSSDELYNRVNNSDDDVVRTNSIPATNEQWMNLRLWASAYSIVYQANSIIERLSLSTAVTPSLKTQLLGEAKFVRALYYFYLVNLFGDVPLVKATDYEVNAIMPRTAKEEIYNQIVSDLIDAKNNLTITYPSAGKVRPNKLAAIALLARVYLYQKDWPKAEAEATSVLSQTQGLELDLTKVFLAGGKEILFELMPAPTFYSTAEGFAFVPTTSATGAPTYPLTDSFALRAFEQPTDKRRVNWVNEKTVPAVNGTKYYYAYKYRIRSGTTVGNEDNVVLRLAEQYLIRAEARIQQNLISESKADLNAIRSRAGLSAITTSDKDSVLNAIFQERRVELFAEWGHRWLDLKRTNRADAILSVFKGSFWQSTDVLYPIPFSQITRNPFLIQNPGY